MIAAELANLGRGGYRRSEDFKAQICAVSDAQTATLLNVSERSVERAKAVKREAIPEVIKLVEDGKLEGSILEVAEARRRSRGGIRGGSTDPLGYIVSANIYRRHMSKGAMAMAVAKLCPETGQTVREAAEAAGVTKTRVGQARIVLQHAPSLVDLVIREEMGLDAAGGANRINGRTRASPAPHPNYPRPGLAHVRR